MEELKQTALTYHSAAPKEFKDVVELFNKEMDPRNNGYVKFKEFSAYMETIGCKNLSSDEFFDLLKQPGNEGLYPDDVITLLYIIYSKRPFCEGNCRKFVPGTFFTCMKCFNGCGSTFNVCPQCYVGEQYKHKHEHEQFRDPMIILHLQRELAINEKSSTSRDEDIPKKKKKKQKKKKRDDADKQESIGSSTITTSTSTSKGRSTSSAATEKSRASSSASSNHKQHTSSSISNSIVPAVNQRSRQTKVQTVIQLGQLVANIGSILVASQLCTIM